MLLIKLLWSSERRDSVSFSWWLLNNFIILNARRIQVLRLDYALYNVFCLPVFNDRKKTHQEYWRRHVSYISCDISWDNGDQKPRVLNMEHVNNPIRRSQNIWFLFPPRCINYFLLLSFFLVNTELKSIILFSTQHPRTLVLSTSPLEPRFHKNNLVSQLQKPFKWNIKYEHNFEHLYIVDAFWSLTFHQINLWKMPAYGGDAYCWVDRHVRKEEA